MFLWSFRKLLSSPPHFLYYPPCFGLKWGISPTFRIFCMQLCRIIHQWGGEIYQSVKYCLTCIIALQWCSASHVWCSTFSMFQMLMFDLLLCFPCKYFTLKFHICFTLLVFHISLMFHMYVVPLLNFASVSQEWCFKCIFHMYMYFWTKMFQYCMKLDIVNRYLNISFKPIEMISAKSIKIISMAFRQIRYYMQKSPSFHSFLPEKPNPPKWKMCSLSIITTRYCTKCTVFAYLQETLISFFFNE